jgi:hypothetical protein
MHLNVQQNQFWRAIQRIRLGHHIQFTAATGWHIGGHFFVEKRHPCKVQPRRHHWKKQREKLLEESTLGKQEGKRKQY